MKNRKIIANEKASVRPSDADKDFVLQSCADLAEAGYGFLHEYSDSRRHLYLVSGEVYQIGESDVTRIR
jgi:hypothetical protein